MEQEHTEIEWNEENRNKLYAKIILTEIAVHLGTRGYTTMQDYTKQSEVRRIKIECYAEIGEYILEFINKNLEIKSKSE